MEMAANTIFTNSGGLQKDWGDKESILWPIACQISNRPDLGDDPFRRRRRTVMAQFDKTGPNSGWSDGLWTLQRRSELEGVLGLWPWSMKLSQEDKVNALARRPAGSLCNRIRVRGLISTAENAAQTEIKLWAPGQLLHLSFDGIDLASLEDGHPSTLWFNSGGGAYGYEMISNNPYHL
jgi:hypothetical protein